MKQARNVAQRRQLRDAPQFLSLGSEFRLSEKQKLPDSRPAEVSSDLKSGSGLRCVLVAGHGSILC